MLGARSEIRSLVACKLVSAHDADQRTDSHDLGPLGFRFGVLGFRV